MRSFLADRIFVYSLFGISFFGDINNNNTGNKVRLVKVATNSVTDVNQPKANVPPKLLKQNMTKPAINTSEVYTILNPVCFIVELTVARISLSCKGSSCL